MKPTYLIIWSVALLLIGIAIGTFWFHDVLYPPMQITDVTDGEWHGVTVKPAIVAASRVPAGVIAQIELTINIAAEHEWAVERGSSGLSTRSNNGIFSGLVRGQDDTTEMDAETSQPNTGDTSVKTYDFVSRGGGWFTTQGEIYHNPWGISVIIQQLTDGSYKVLTDEDGVSFTVKSAVKVNTSSWIRTGLSAGYDGKGNLSAGGNLLLWNHVQVLGGYRTDNAWELKGGWLW